MADRVTIAQVAEAAGVSAMTVSNVVNGRAGASDATRQRVLSTVEQLGYKPNSAARSLKSGRTGLIGLLTLDLAGQYGMEIIRGVAEELKDAEQEILLSGSVDTEREADRIQFFMRNFVDGILLMAPILADATLDLVRESPVPIVVMDPRQLDLDLPRVTVDNYSGTRQATEYLLGLGHTRISYLRGADDLESSEVRYRGYADAMRLAGLTVTAEHVRTSGFAYADGFAEGVALLDAYTPTAVIGGADILTIGAMDAARSRGLSIPDDISFVGFDDLPQASQTYPALTTVRQPLHDMGQAAARALISLIEGRPLVAEHIVLPTTLLVRGTTGPPAHPTPAPGLALSDVPAGR